MNKTSGAVAETQEENAIPGVDLGPYMRGEPGALDEAARQVREVCENVGFFYIYNHGVPQYLIDRAFAASKRFHAQPLEKKQAIPINQDNVGYLGLNRSMQRMSKVEKATKPNLNESFFCMRDRAPNDPDVLSGKQFRGLNQWPEDLPGFREDTVAYANSMEVLGKQMLPVMARALDLPADYLDRFFQPPQYSLRMLHYPTQDVGEEGQYGTGAHTDAGFLTFLAQDKVSGLQIRKTDETWFNAPIIPGSFIVNTGDMMRRWTNDRFLSTPHRVRNVAGVDRYSIAFFFSMNLDQTIECLPSCQDENNPPKYEPTTFLAYRTEFINTNYFHRQGQKANNVA